MKSISPIRPGRSLSITKGLCFMMASFILIACTLSSKPGHGNSQIEPGEKFADSTTIMHSHPVIKPIDRSPFLTLADAEKILGECVHVIDSSTILGPESLTFQCGYAANEMDSKTQKRGAIYFLVEKFNEITGAQKRYSFIMESNRANGIKELKGLGDEAYFHTDGENFYFVMVRKGVNVFNMKVNKITSTTSLDLFNDVARQITAAL
jgi:hypothetical protein